MKIAHRAALDSSHHGIATPAVQVLGQGRGRRKIVIDPVFLRIVYGMSSTSAIARLLRVSRPVVRKALLQYGIATPGRRPIQRVSASSVLGAAVLQARSAAARTENRQSSSDDSSDDSESGSESGSECMRTVETFTLVKYIDKRHPYDSR